VKCQEFKIFWILDPWRWADAHP